MENCNYIVSSYLTSGIDHQRGSTKEIDDPKYIEKWAQSIRNLGLNGVVLHDGLTDAFISCYPYIRFIKVEPIPKGMQLYDYRWVIYYEFMLNNTVDAVFFTDISDIIVKRNPFYEMQDELYCGDEPTTIKGCKWLQTSRKSLGGIEDYKFFLHSNNTLLNCGIFGGYSDRVKAFLDIMMRYIEFYKDREGRFQEPG